MSKSDSDEFIQGIKDGIPIALGYLSVSFGFGITSVTKGLSVLITVLISATNLTSAGQVAGIGIISAGGTLIEMAIAQFIINMRYSLMSISLSQKLDENFTLKHRLAVSFGITDEIFAVASSRKCELKSQYMYGLIFMPFVGWVIGTLLGAAAGEVLPEYLKSALGIMIYGMFIAIFVPPARKAVGVLIVVLISVTMSCCFKYIPALQEVSSGFAIIICALFASIAGALLFPVKESDCKE